MPAQSSLTLNTKVYAPRGTQGGLSSWAHSGASLGGGNSALTESVRPYNSEGNAIVRWLLTAEKLAAADSACACTGAPLGDPARVDTRASFPRSFTETERLDLYDRYVAEVNTPAFKASFVQLEGSWG